MDAKRPLDRFETLAVRQNLSLGVLHGASRSDFSLMMAAAGLAFAPGQAYSEREINDRLREWLAGAGSMLAVDHVELRRWLVDTGVLARDGYGRAYERATPWEDIERAMDQLAGHDLATLVRSAQMRDAGARAERKAKWSAKRAHLVADAALLRARRAELVDLVADAVRGGASIGFVLPVDLAAIDRFWDAMTEEVERGERIVRVAEREGRIAGSVQLAPCAKANGRHRAEVQKLLVHSSARRAGLGRALMTAIEADAAQSGRWLLLLDTRETSAAEMLYQDAGWREYGRVPDYAADPDGTLAGCTFFYKRLAQPA